MSLIGVVLTIAMLAVQAVEPNAFNPISRSIGAAPVEPTTNWRVTQDAERCMASRTYGAGDTQIALALHRPAASNLIRIGIAGSEIGLQGERPRYDVQLGDATAINDIPGRLVTVPGRRRMAFVELILGDIDASLRAARTLRFAPERGNPHLLRIDDVAGTLDQLETCRRGMLASWGFDLAAVERLRRPPVPISPETWLDRNSIPAFSGRADAAVMLAISGDGRVVACRTVDSSGSQAIDENICTQLMAHARYEPAIGADGTPVATQVIRSVRYQTPR